MTLCPLLSVLLFLQPAVVTQSFEFFLDHHATFIYPHITFVDYNYRPMALFAVVLRRIMKWKARMRLLTLTFDQCFANENK